MPHKVAGPNVAHKGGAGGDLEYLRQIGKRMQTYWGTAHPKKFVQTFTEIGQMLSGGADGLCIRIIDETILHRVRLNIEPYTNAQMNKASHLKPFYVSAETLEYFRQCYGDAKPDAANLSLQQTLGLEFCIGKETPDQELYDYYVIVQAVDLSHNRLINANCLPFTAPEIAAPQG